MHPLLDAFFATNSTNTLTLLVALRVDTCLCIPFLHLLPLGCRHGHVLNSAALVELPLFLKLDDIGDDIDEHAGLEQRLPGVVLEAENEHAHAQTLLGVADAVYEVGVAREKRDTVDVGA